MDNIPEAKNIVKEQIGKLGKNYFLLWPFSLILIIISNFYLENLFSILGLLVMAMMFSKSIKLIVLINAYDRIIYELYGYRSPYKKKFLIAGFVNIVLIGLSMYLFYRHQSLLLTSLIIIISFSVFTGLGVVVSRGGETENIESSVP